ncbi:RTA1-domain-containing protein [Neofusicoccum parvum]|nr:RTA1-domain-containing protein [Neofusicoccum parvum]
MNRLVATADPAQFETIGYAARAGAHNNTKSLPPYIAQSLLILLAPIFFAASIYAVLGRLIRRVDGDDISIVHPSIMTRFFVYGDVLCFFIQSGGSGILAQAKKQSAMKLGNNVILVGLGLQIYIFCFFVKIAMSFHRDLLKHPTASALNEKFPWQRYMVLLYVACACVGVRNTYRVVEYAMGRGGFLVVHEWPLYIGDFTLMAITLITCLTWYDLDIKPRKGDLEMEEGVNLRYAQI